MGIAGGTETDRSSVPTGRKTIYGRHSDVGFDGTLSEVSYIYNAVLEGASSLMLTGETAVGGYPAEAMRYLVKTAKSGLRHRIV